VTEALEIFARARRRVLGWEGWIRTPDGRVGHGDAPMGCEDLSAFNDQEAIAICRQTIDAAHSAWNGSVAHPGAELLFCIALAIA
jgi:hypothetical protein